MRKAFFAIVIASLFSLSAAQLCEVTGMTPAEQNSWFKNIFSYASDEVNGLREEALRANTPGQVQQVNVFTGAADGYVLQDVAGLLGVDPITLGAEFGVYPDKTLTRAEAERIGRREGEKLSRDDVLNYKLTRAQVLTIVTRRPDKAAAINKLLGISAGVEKEALPYQNLKVRMPGEQKDVPLSELLERPEINSSDCFISSSNIKGRLEFVTLLDSDLRLGAEGVSTKNAPGQHVSYSRATAAIGPYDSTLVVPRQFERYVTALGEWASFDMWATIIESMVIHTELSAIQKQAAGTRTKFEGELSRITLLGKEAYQSTHSIDRLGGQIAINRLDNFGNIIRNPTPIDPTKPFDFLVSAKEFKDGYIQRNILVDGQVVSSDEFKKLVQGFDFPAGLSQDDVSNSIRATLGIGLNDEILSYAQKEKDLTDLAKRVQLRTINTFVFGLAWLGPSRFALDLSNSLLLDSSSAGNDQYFDLYIKNNKYLEDFRKATDFMGTGNIADFASDVLGQGVPTKVYSTGKMYFVNNPILDRDAPTTATSGFSQEAGRWLINFNWREGGDSRTEGVFFEDLRDLKDYSSIAFSSKNQRISLGMDRQRLNAEMFRALETLAPLFNFLLYRVESIPASAVGLGQLAIYNFIINNFVDPAGFDPEEKCDPEKVDSFIAWYKSLVVASQAEIILPYFKIGPAKIANYFAELATPILSNTVKTYVQTAGAAGQAALGSKYTKALIFLDPIQLAKQLYGTRGQRYVSYCKDDEYKVVAWQKLAAASTPGLSEKLKSSGVEQLTKGLNIGQALSGVGQEVKAKQLGDALSFRSVYYDGFGSINSPSLVYLHLDGGSMQWHSVYAQAKSCFKSNLQSKDGSTFILDENGVRKSINGTSTLNLTGPAWRDRSLFSQRLPGLSMTLVPNKIITTELNCGSESAIEVDSKGKLAASGGCAGTICMVSKVLEVSGETDFSKAIGKVDRIETSKGTIMISNGVIYFYPSSGSEANKETRVPSVEAAEAGVKEGGRIVVDGNGRVIVSGYLTSEVGELDAGTLRTIIAEHSRIEFEEPTKTLRIALYSMARMLGNDVLGLSARPALNKDENGRDVPGVRLGDVRAKAGSEEAAANFNRALEKIQGPTGSLQMIETPDHTYFFTTDAQGRPVLKIFDKKTGQVREIPITGTVTRDANGNIVVPTQDGDYKFKFDMQDGKPVVNVNGPGISELATLLAARGPNGILAFNPTTGLWELFNGQDIPWNRDFAKNGLSVFGGPDGVKGIAQPSFFAPPRREGATTGLGPLAAFPSWPEGYLLVAMVGAIAAGAALVRLRKD